MTPKGEPDVAVEDWQQTKDGSVVGKVRWAAAPGAVFLLEITSDGRLVKCWATADEGKALSARQLRAAPVGAMERSIRREVAGTGEAMQTFTTLYRGLVERWLPEGSAERAELLDQAAGLPEFARSLADFAERPRTGPAGRDDRSYAALAALYVRLINDGEQRPIRAVADRLGLAEKTVQNHLFKARERGLLTSLGRGRAGGQLTDKAKEILSVHHQAP